MDAAFAGCVANAPFAALATTPPCPHLARCRSFLWECCVSFSTIARRPGAAITATERTRHGRGRSVAVCLLRADLCDGGGRRDYAADPLRPVDHRVEPGHRHHPAADRGPVGHGIRPLPADPRIPADPLRDEPGRIQRHLFLGIRAPAVGPADRGCLCRAIGLVLAARAPAAPAGSGAARHTGAGLWPGIARLVHGRKRARPSGRSQPVPPRRPSRPGAGDLRLDPVDGARSVISLCALQRGEGGGSEAGG